VLDGTGVGVGSTWVGVGFRVTVAILVRVGVGERVAVGDGRWVAGAVCVAGAEAVCDGTIIKVGEDALVGVFVGEPAQPVTNRARSANVIPGPGEKLWRFVNILMHPDHSVNTNPLARFWISFKVESPAIFLCNSSRPNARISFHPFYIQTRM